MSYEGQLPSFSGALSTISKSLPDWNVQDVQDFLARCASKLGNRMQSYQQLVAENDIDGEVLEVLEDDDLKRLGIKSLGHRLFILKAIKHCKELHVSSRHDAQDVSSGHDAHHPGGHHAPSSARPVGSWSSASTAPVTQLVEERFTFTSAREAQEARQRGGGQLPTAQNGYGLDAPQGLRAVAQVEPLMRKAAPCIHESKIKVHAKIGTGSVATVYAGSYESHKVAIKKHTLEPGIDGKHLSDLEMEVGKMIAINHPCVVRCFGMLEPTPGIVLELVEGGSVFEIIHGRHGESLPQYNARLPWEHRMSFLMDMMYGLRAIHNVGMIHGDLKTLNLLVTLEGRVKVADFGLSKVLGAVSIVPGTKTITGTPQYMAPEVMHCQPQSLRVDIYAVGVIMWEMMTGVIPWKELDYVQIIQRVTHPSNETELIPPGRPKIDNVYRSLAPSGYIHLLEDCWAQESRYRPSADQCIETLQEIRARLGDLQPHAPTSHDALALPVQQSLSLASHARPIPNAGLRAGHQGEFGQKRAAERGQDVLFDEASKRPRFDGYASGGGHGAGLHQPSPKHPGGLQGDVHGPPDYGTTDYGAPALSMAASNLPAMIDALKTGVRSQVMVALTAIFELLLDNSQQQHAFFEAQGLQYVLPYLEQDDQPELQAKAANCVAVAVSQNPCNRQFVVSSGAIAVLVRLLGGTPSQQESAAHAVANLVKRPTDKETKMLRDMEELANMKMVLVDAQEELLRLGGIEKLVNLMDKGSARVRLAACAAVANAMTECSENREAFQEANGIFQLIRMLREGDCHAQDNAATALWNALVDNSEALKQFNRMNGHECLIKLLNEGTDLGKELAAGAIWKLCAADDSDKVCFTPAVFGLVRLLRSERLSSHEQAAGALRSVLVSSPQNKMELHRVNGIGALVSTLRNSTRAASEQAGAALANACANCMANQIAARHAGSMSVLVEVLARTDSENMIECCVCAIRNLCINCVEHQEELARCNGLVPLMQLLHRTTKPQLLEYVASALAKACSLCPENLAVLRLQYGVGALEWLMGDKDVTDQTKLHVQILIDGINKWDVASAAGDLSRR